MGALLAALLLAPLQGFADPVQSLRGPSELDNVRPADDMKRVQRDTAPIARNYVQQPPLIPHSIRDYDVTLNNNKCLECHGWSNYQYYKATKISQTHFTDSQGIDLADVSPRRYFCNQCHVTQTDARPLIDNEFTPVEALSSKH